MNQKTPGRKAKDGQALAPQYFALHFQSRVSEEYGAAEIGAAMLGRTLKYLAPEALGAAIGAGLLPERPAVELGNLSGARRAVEATPARAVAAAVASSPQLAQFLLAHLMAAQCAAQLARLEAWEWHGLGDDRAFEDTPHEYARADFAARFGELLQDRPALAREWEASGLTHAAFFDTKARS